MLTLSPMVPASRAVASVADPFRNDITARPNDATNATPRTTAISLCSAIAATKNPRKTKPSNTSRYPTTGFNMRRTSFDNVLTS